MAIYHYHNLLSLGYHMHNMCFMFMCYNFTNIGPRLWHSQGTSHRYEKGVSSRTHSSITFPGTTVQTDRQNNHHHLRIFQSSGCSFPFPSLPVRSSSSFTWPIPLFLPFFSTLSLPLSLPLSPSLSLSLPLFLSLSLSPSLSLSLMQRSTNYVIVVDSSKSQV